MDGCKAACGTANVMFDCPMLRNGDAASNSTPVVPVIQVNDVLPTQDVASRRCARLCPSNSDTQSAPAVPSQLSSADLPASSKRQSNHLSAVENRGRHKMEQKPRKTLRLRPSERLGGGEWSQSSCGESDDSLDGEVVKLNMNTANLAVDEGPPASSRSTSLQLSVGVPQFRRHSWIG